MRNSFNLSVLSNIMKEKESWSFSIVKVILIMNCSYYHVVLHNVNILIDSLTDLLIDLFVIFFFFVLCHFEDNLTLEMLLNFYVLDGCHTFWGTESGLDLEHELHGFIQYDVLYTVILFLFCYLFSLKR